jgi:hypothetical protein
LPVVKGSSHRQDKKKTSFVSWTEEVGGDDEFPRQQLLALPLCLWTSRLGIF